MKAIRSDAINLTGRCFGRLTVLASTRNQVGTLLWICRCACGTERTVRSQHLRNGTTESCGCFQQEVARQQFTKHGESLTPTPEYRAWESLKARCLNPNNKRYKNYGGRSITVCQRWLDSFGNFLADMGRKPTPKHSIDRINNDSNYEPTNCRWATSAEQRRNRSSHYTKPLKPLKLCKQCKRPLNKGDLFCSNRCARLNDWSEQGQRRIAMATNS